MPQRSLERFPKWGRGMQDIRTEIDTLDRQIMALLDQRTGYVPAAFKTSAASVRVEERVSAMLAVLCQWTEEEPLPPILVDSVYWARLQGVIAHEMSR